MNRKILTDTRDDGATEIAWDDSGSALGDFDYTGYVLINADGGLHVPVGPDGIRFTMDKNDCRIEDDRGKVLWSARDEGVIY